MPALNRRCLRPLALLFGALIVSTAASSQDYSKSAPLFPNVLKPYQSRHVDQPNLANSPRVTQLIRDGKLMLSLDDAIALALENNLDLVIARYNLPIADTDILRTKSGAAARGVNTGVLQGTPGGGVGGIGNTGAAGGGAGGTSAAAGGAGTGIGGLVASTLGVGPVVGSYDPIFTSSLGIQHSNTPEANTVFTGVPSLLQNTATANFGYLQAFSSGTQVNVAFNNSRVTSNSIRTLLLPQLNLDYQIQVTQHLLQGLSFAANRRFIIIAKNNREIADVSFRQQVIFTVTQIENIYWNLVSAYQDLQAKERALQLAQQLEANNERQLRVGTLAQIDVVNAQAQVASSQQALIVSQTNLELQQLLMKNAITKRESDPVIAVAEVIPTDIMELPAVEPVVPVQDLVQQALQQRPELAQARIDLANRRISEASARNALLPSLDLVASYGGASLAGNPNPFFATFAGANSTAGIVSSGYVDAFTALNEHPSYFVGFNLNIPIRNRAAQADQIRSELEYRQAEARIQQMENEIAIDVRNAQFAVQQNRAAVNAARSAREYAAQVLDAEQKKLAQGMSTTFNVLSDMANLSTAESNLVSAMTAYEQSKVQLDVVTGDTLQRLGIDMNDSESGTVTHMPHVPGVTAGLPPAAPPVLPTLPRVQPPQTPPKR